MLVPIFHDSLFSLMVKSDYAIDLTNTIYHAILHEFGNVSVRSNASRINTERFKIDEIELKISFDGSHMDSCGDKSNASVVIRIEDTLHSETRTEVFAIMKITYNENYDIESLVKKYKELRPVFTLKNKMHYAFRPKDYELEQEKTVDFKFAIYKTGNYHDYGVEERTVQCIRAFLDIFNQMKPLPRDFL